MVLVRAFLFTSTIESLRGAKTVYKSAEVEKLTNKKFFVMSNDRTFVLDSLWSKKPSKYKRLPRPNVFEAFKDQTLLERVFFN